MSHTVLETVLPDDGRDRPLGIALPRTLLRRGTDEPIDRRRSTWRFEPAGGPTSGSPTTLTSGPTPAACLLSAFGVLLARQAGVDELVFWVTRAVAAAVTTDAGLVGVPEGPSAVGPASAGTAVPVRLRYEASGPVESFVADVASAVRADPEPYPEPAIEDADLVTVGLAVAGEPGLAVDLMLVLSPDGRPLALDYRPDRLDDAAVSRLGDGLVVLLEQLPAAPGTRIGDLELLSSADRARILREWSGADVAGPVAVPGFVAVPERVTRIARQTPTSIAVVSAAQTLSYQELDQQADRLAAHLQATGVRPGDLVALCLGRSTSMIVAMLAVLKAGAAYLPLDPEYPLARLAFLLDDAAPAAVLTEKAYRSRIPVTTAGCIELDADPGRGAPAPGSPPAVITAGPDDRAYVIYTSGSTGLPKGVEITFSGLENLIEWHRAAYRLDAGDHTSHLAGTAFDASVWEIWPTLAVGATLHLGDPAVIGSPAELVRWFGEHRITVGFLPTPLAELVLHERWPDDSPLRHLLTGGDRLHHRPPTGLPFTLVNHYGPTENTVVSTASPVAPAGLDDEERREPPIGRPITGTRVYVLDERRRPVPVGVPGELYVGGAGLARGYLNRPELTAERFVPDPFDPDPQARLYRTGDRVCWRPDGEIDFLGRLDDQVKLRGLRIELGEIEAALTAQPGIAEAVVMLREDTPGHQRLIGYLVPQGDDAPDGVRLREALRQQLPGYMVPSGFVELPALPLTRNGKVDRRALPEPEPDREPALGAYRAPQPGIETEVAALWSELLGIPSIGALDDFFALGGDSLAATRVAARLGETFAVGIPLSVVLAEPTVRSLAAEIDRLQGQPLEVQAGPITPVPRARTFPLTVAQGQFWLLDQLDAGNTYLVPLTIEITGPLQVAALRRALTAVIARHEPLRTVFPLTDGQPVQQILDPPAEIELPVVDAARIEDVDRWVREQSRLPMDVTTGPLLRTRLLRQGPTSNVLLIVVHHLVFDGWSLGIFCRDLAEHYRALVEGDRPDLEPLPVQSADLAVWEREHLTAENLAADREYWRGQLAGAPAVLELPTDLVRPTRPSAAGGRRTRFLSADLTERVAAFARSQAGTPFMTLFAAFNLVLSRYCGAQDIVVGSPVAGRIRAELEPMVGCFINTLPLRTDLSGDPDFREVLARVRATAVAAHGHQNLSLAQIVDAVGVDRSGAHSPLFQVVFAFEDAHRAEFELAGLPATVTEVDFGQARSDLGLSVTPVGDRLRVSAEYRSELFTPESVDRLLGHYVTVLEAALADPQTPVARLPMLSADEQRRQIEDWNDTAAEFADGTTLHELVQAQVDRTPDATAVVFEDELTLTYRDLDERANRLAHHLRALGVRPESRVGICLHRSPEMVIAVLAVLKAGGGYVPLDPANPAERLDFITADAGLTVVLTEQALRGSSAWAGAEVVELDRVGAELDARPATRPTNVNGARDLAYVIYTSGSTGKPKGVLIEHRSVANFMASVHRLFEMGPHDSVLQFASLGFDVSVFEIFSALTCGARLCLARQDTLLSVKDLTRFMQRQRISVMDMPPPVMALLPGDAFPALRIAFVGGEAFSGGLVNQWAVPGRRFFNGYGPTEGTVTVIVEECSASAADQSPPIGRPMGNMRAYVLDPQDRLVPVGIPGQLHIGGVGLARGYLDRPELTEEKFVPDPFVDEPGARLYRTGDQVRQLPDGRLEFLGRIDDQVKLRGFRIELGEIEAVLRGHPDVADAAVLLREDVPGQRRLVGYLVARPATADLDQAAVSGYLAERLPPYMVPAAFVRLAEFRLNSSGKIDRKLLPPPAAGDLTALAAPAAPRNRRETTLVELWTRLLGLPEVGVHDNFFALGGHSLLGVQLVWEVSGAFGVDISVRDVFTRPTIAGLAEVIEDAMLARLVADRANPPHRTGPEESR